MGPLPVATSASEWNDGRFIHSLAPVATTAPRCEKSLL
jgi:hypothetical protein